MDLPVSVQTSLPVSEWVNNMLLKPKSACAQVSTLQKWHPYLQQGNVYNSSLLSEKLHALLGPGSYVNLDMAPQIPPIAPLSAKSETESGPFLLRHGSPMAAVKAIPPPGPLQQFAWISMSFGLKKALSTAVSGLNWGQYSLRSLINLRPSIQPQTSGLCEKD